jgi:protein O-mannosyl-transferase
VKNNKGNKNSEHFPLVKNKLVIYLLFLVLVPAAVYFRVVYFEYTGLDDSVIVFNINNVQGGRLNLKEAFTHDAFMGNQGDTFYRPLQLISLMLDAEIGGKEPWIFHLSNLLLHILTVIVLFFFLKKTGIKDEISFLLALLFSINPLFTNAVAWIPARGDILLCLFSLLSFVTFMEYFDTQKKYYLYFHAVVFLLAVLSKETAVLIPVLILSYFYFVKKKTFVLKDILSFLLIWAISFILFFLMRQTIIKVNPTSNIFGIIPFIKNLPAIPSTFFKFFFPYGLSTMPLFNNIELIGGIIFLVVFIIVIFRFIPKEWRIIIWGGGWFLAFSAPPMLYRTYFASFGIEYFEYRAYLPIIGILFICGFLINELTRGISYTKVLIVSSVLILVYSAISFIHSEDFANPLSFFNSAIRSDSNNAMAIEERGTVYYDKGDKDKSLSDFDNSIKICPAFPIPYFNKGVVYNAMNDHAQAEYFFSLALRKDTINRDIHLLRSDIYVKLSDEKLSLRKFDEAKALLKKGISKYPDDAKLHNQLGMAFYNTMKFDSAFNEYNKAIELDKNVYTYYDNRGMAAFHLKDFKKALNDFNSVIDMQPDFKDTWGSRGMTKIELHDYEGAVYDLTKSISFTPNDGAAYYFRGIAYLRLNRLTEAKEDWKKAIELGNKSAVGLIEKY